MTGSVTSLQACPGDRGPMRPLQAAELADGGIPGDAHFQPGSARQLLLIEGETLEALGLEPGVVRENLTVSGVPLMGLESGTRLSIGGAEVEITKVCAPCSRMDAIREGLQDQLEGRRGMYGRVTRPGSVAVGDPVEVVGSPA